MAQLSPPPAADLRPGQRVFRAALVGAVLGAVTCLLAAVLPLFFLGIALDPGGTGRADPVTGVVSGAMVVVPIALFFVAVPLLRKAQVRPVWSVALISALATVALASCAVALSGLDPYAALLGAPLLATGGYALGALLTTSGLLRRGSRADRS